MSREEKITEVINKLKKAIESGDQEKKYDAISLAYRLYGEVIPAIADCYNEAVQYSGTTTRNAAIMIDLLDNHLKEQSATSDSFPYGSLTTLEKGLFVKLFNRGGYVLNFSTNDFDVFTMESVGIALCDHYKQSKGKSLIAYIQEASEENAIKLLFDLFDYYEENYEGEYKKDNETPAYYSPFNVEYSRTYYKCKAIVERLRGTGIPLAPVAKELSRSFSSEYMTKQFELMLTLCDSNPTEAIGKAKELIESCCITILEELGIERDKNWDVGQLAGAAVKQLKLTPQDIPESAPLADDMKAILGNLRAIATNVAKLRNPYGSGHGKSASYKGLEKRHARLAVGSSITFVEFLWSTYESRM